MSLNVFLASVICQIIINGINHMYFLHYCHFSGTLLRQTQQRMHDSEKKIKKNTSVIIIVLNIHACIAKHATKNNIQVLTAQ